MSSSSPPTSGSRSDDRSYAAAVTLLNTLQTNAATLDQVRKAYKPGDPNRYALPEMIDFVHRTGHQCDDLNRLGLIHITGTKGKGSTGAFVERMLRSVGEFPATGQRIKTGLYTSPHLMEVRERIRVDGKPLDRDLFAKYFFEVWDRLSATEAEAVKQGQLAKPNYFRFLTCLAFHVFLRENTNATILEVGIGGMYDSTNVITRPVVTGIASLGYDHVSILGNTLAQIGRQKAGIMKRGVPCVTIPQPAEGMQALVEYAAEIGAKELTLAAPLPQSDEDEQGIELGLKGAHQRLNAALAVGLVHEVLGVRVDARTVAEATESFASLVPKYLAQGTNPHLLLADPVADTKTHAEESAPYTFPVTQRLTGPLAPALVEGLATTTWPGRAQTITRGPVTFFADGAHTVESLRACAHWFTSTIKPAGGQQKQQQQQQQHLIFNLTHARDPRAMLRPLAGYSWASVTFTSNEPGIGGSRGGDTANYNEHKDDELKAQRAMRDAWVDMTGMHAEKVHVVRTVSEAVEGVAEGNVLVTGSLYLVGALLEVLGVSVD
ncbi:Mur ligase [Catenaria anguillulae PL171]|uniref:Folylpolyglutamate synthase n=1 Tax=Catenaria anguillulae PL171 TaxID=765915 RepID=A0A1Y2HRY6_9FUNG|nr:Mur ligase [Catenaria anguillulae PL171]